MMNGRARFFLVLLATGLPLAAAGTSLAEAKAAPARPAVAKSAVQAKKVTFLELGSVGCRPCDAMRPVMDAVRQRHGKDVEVTFHDVRKNPDVAQQYRVVLIPTQVFLNAEGREVFRHEGFLEFEKVEEVLRQLGVQ